MRFLKQLRPQERKNRLQTFGWLLTGLYLVRWVHLSRVASKIPSTAKLPSTVPRLSRLLDNCAIRVRSWYAPIARAWLTQAAQTTGEIRLIVGSSKIGCHHQLLIVSLAFRRRAIPIAWMWMPHKKGHSSARKQPALLGYAYALLPGGVPVLLVGDGEFGAVSVLRQRDEWGWGYVLRQKSNNTVSPSGGGAWRNFADCIQQAGQTIWLSQWLLTQTQPYRTNLLAYWQSAETQPWLLATNLPTPKRALAGERRRMWIDEMFVHFKGNGFELEQSHWHHFLRLWRLTLAVVLLYVWLVVYGAKVIKSGQRDLVERADRRDLSLFRIGWHMVERRLTQSAAVSIGLSLHL